MTTAAGFRLGIILLAGVHYTASFNASSGGNASGFAPAGPANASSQPEGAGQKLPTLGAAGMQKEAVKNATKLSAFPATVRPSALLDRKTWVRREVRPATRRHAARDVEVDAEADPEEREEEDRRLSGPSQGRSLLSKRDMKEAHAGRLGAGEGFGLADCPETKVAQCSSIMPAHESLCLNFYMSRDGTTIICGSEFVSSPFSESIEPVWTGRCLDLDDSRHCTENVR
eukprot:TRINITY_DN42027_c0_g1_i1.p2 TRINITY_DN42027_c0_g1~~TRINITY_DN42027_c0_g1_i1.p2  ORF type:complete len:260 (-),score=47.52 TRINITY_DN42027_c0_g1_i1:46-729(-)